MKKPILHLYDDTIFNTSNHYLLNVETCRNGGFCAPFLAMTKNMQASFCLCALSKRLIKTVQACFDSVADLIK